MPRVLTDTCMELMDTIPPWAREDPDVQAAFQVMSNEVDKLDAAITNVVANYFPQLAADYLHLWEARLGISVRPVDLSVSQRQQRVLAFLMLRTNAAQGRTWVTNVTMLIGPTWTWERHTPGSSTGVPADTIQLNLPYAEGSSKAADLIRLLRISTPANTDLVVNYGEGFIVQESQIGYQPL